MRGHKLKIPQKDFLSLKIDLFLAISADPNEMPNYVTFHLCLRCLQKKNMSQGVLSLQTVKVYDFNKCELVINLIIGFIFDKRASLLNL